VLGTSDEKLVSDPLLGSRSSASANDALAAHTKWAIDPSLHPRSFVNMTANRKTRCVTTDRPVTKRGEPSTDAATDPEGSGAEGLGVVHDAVTVPATMARLSATASLPTAQHYRVRAKTGTSVRCIEVPLLPHSTGMARAMDAERSL